MGLFSGLNRRGSAVADVPAPSGEWYEEVMQMARAHGAFPYLVEGYLEIMEAVRRGHSVMLRREECEVADGVTVFAGRSKAAVGGDMLNWAARPDAEPVITVRSFDVKTARFVVHDPASITGTIELTPKRLARYVGDDARAVGIAMGA